MNEIETRLESCFSAVFPALSEEEIHRASQASVAEWDSVNAITLLNAIEEEFQITVGLELASELSSFALVADYLKGRADVS